MQNELKELERTLALMGKSAKSRKVSHLIKISTDSNIVKNASLIKNAAEETDGWWIDPDNQAITYYIEVDNRAKPTYYSLKKRDESNRWAALAKKYLAPGAAAAAGAVAGGRLGGAAGDVVGEVAQENLSPGGQAIEAGSRLAGGAAGAVGGGVLGKSLYDMLSKFMGWGKGTPILTIKLNPDTGSFYITSGKKSDGESILREGSKKADVSAADKALINGFLTALESLGSEGAVPAEASIAQTPTEQSRQQQPRA